MNHSSNPRPPFLSSLRRRSLTPEWMDDPNLDPALHRQALAGLARLNRLGNADGLLWPFLAEQLRTARRPLRVLDVACGSGDVLNALSHRATGRIRGLGLDISPRAIAEARSQAVPRVRFQVQDVLDPAVALPRCDVAICSLFLHHLTRGQVVSLLRRMAEAAGRAVIISDLERSPVAWWLVWMGAHLVTRSPVVHLDSDLSVRAAWTPQELGALARQAGIRDARVQRVFPARLVMVARTGRILASDEGTTTRVRAIVTERSLS